MRRQLQLIREAKTSFVKPTGLLSIHLKHLEITHLDVYRLFKRYEFAVYIRVTLDDQIKYTSMITRVSLPLSVTFDELKFLNVRPTPKRSDRCNFLRLEVIVLDTDKPETHTIICMREIHIFEVIRAMLEIRTLELRNMDRQIGELDLEFCFQYGAFGYGVSNQFENRQKTFKDQVTHSMFHRSKPPENRCEYEYDIIQCKHIGHPYYIPFERKSEIQPVGEDLGLDFKVHGNQIIPQPSHVMTRVLGPLRKRQQEFSQITNRRQRLDYLRNLFHTTRDHTTINHDQFTVPDDFRLKARKAKQDKTKDADENAPPPPPKKVKRGTIFFPAFLEADPEDEESFHNMSFCNRCCMRIRRLFTKNRVEPVDDEKEINVDEQATA